MTTTSSNKGDIMKTIEIIAEDSQRLNDALTQVQLHGLSEDWDAIETLDTLGAIVWDDDDRMWSIVDGGVRLSVLSDVEHTLADLVAINYPSSIYARRIEWKCLCGKSGAIEDGQIGATYKRARSAHKRHVAAATKSAR
jgi:hypothetical protein